MAGGGPGSPYRHKRLGQQEQFFPLQLAIGEQFAELPDIEEIDAVNGHPGIFSGLGWWVIAQIELPAKKDSHRLGHPLETRDHEVRLYGEAAIGSLDKQALCNALEFGREAFHSVAALDVLDGRVGVSDVERS